MTVHESSLGAEKYKALDTFIYILIILSAVSMFLDSYEGIHVKYGNILSRFELFCVLVFTLEYIVRTFSSIKVHGKLKYNFSFLGIIDVVSILPYYLPIFFALDLRSIRLLRLVRLARILKIARHSKAINQLVRVLYSIRHQLQLTFFLSFIVIVISGMLIYYAEHEEQPEVFQNMGQSIWWAVATLTTVGYGDIYPVTGIGKTIASIVALVGIGLIAIPTGLISAAYVEMVDKESK